VILRVPSAIRTMHDYFEGEKPIMWLSVLQAFGDYGQGFANGLWFVMFQQEVRREIHSYVFGMQRITTEIETTEIAELKNTATELFPGQGTSTDEDGIYRSFQDSNTHTPTLTSATRPENSSIDKSITS